MESNRKEDLKYIIITIGINLFILLCLIYLLTEEESSIVLIMGFVIILICETLFTIWAVRTYRDQYINRKDRGALQVDKRMEKARKKVYEKMPGKNMYEVCRKFMVEVRISNAVLIGVMLGILGWIIYIQTDNTGVEDIVHGIQKGTDWRLLAQIGFYKLGPYILIPILGVVGTYIYLYFQTDAVKRLKEVVERSPYDYEDVNMDFLGGTKHLLFNGLFSMGARYVVVCHIEMALVLEMSEIYDVKKEKIIEKHRAGMGMQSDIERFYINIYTTQGKGSFMCMHEMAADLIMEQFALRGLFDHGKEEQKIQADIS